MEHYIIVKFKENVENKEKLYPCIKELFDKAKDINGIHEIVFTVSNSTLENRYDLMIKMILEKESLTLFDNSIIHQQWKKDYNKYIASKVIFDGN